MGALLSKIVWCSGSNVSLNHNDLALIHNVDPFTNRNQFLSCRLTSKCLTSFRRRSSKSEKSVSLEGKISQSGCRFVTIAESWNVEIHCNTNVTNHDHDDTNEVDDHHQDKKKAELCQDEQEVKSESEASSNGKKLRRLETIVERLEIESNNNGPVQQKGKTTWRGRIVLHAKDEEQAEWSVPDPGWIGWPLWDRPPPPLPTRAVATDCLSGQMPFLHSLFIWRFTTTHHFLLVQRSTKCNNDVNSKMSWTFPPIIFSDFWTVS